jgi:hypothetical protein
VAASKVDSIAAPARGGGVGSRASADWSSPSASVLVSPPSHDKSMDFLHHEVQHQQFTLDDCITNQEFRELTELTILSSQSEHLVY